MCQRTLDSTLHCDGPDREIYCRGIFRLKNLQVTHSPAQSSTLSRFVTQISALTALCSDTLNYHYLQNPLIYLFIFHSDSFVFFFLLLSTKISLWTLPAPPGNSPRAQGLQSVAEAGHWSSIPLLLLSSPLMCRRVNICLVPHRCVLRM